MNQTTRRRGFTLLELIITVAVAGILAAIAYPIYQNQVERGRRVDAQSALTRTAHELERCYTVRNKYEADCVDVPRDTENEYYRIDFQNGSPTNTAFTLTATPQNVQANDDCGTLTLEQTGARGAGGDVDQCW